MVGLSFATFIYFIDESIELARTGLFIVMAFSQLFNVFNLRSIKKSVFEIGIFSNNYINIAVLLSAILIVLVTEVGAVARIFHFESISFLHFSILFALSSLILWCGEIYKRLKN